MFDTEKARRRRGCVDGWDRLTAGLTHSDDFTSKSYWCQLIRRLL